MSSPLQQAAVVVGAVRHAFNYSSQDSIASKWVAPWSWNAYSARMKTTIGPASSAR